MKRRPYLDFIRGIAALLVVAEHVRSATIVSYAELKYPATVPLKMFYVATGMGHSSVLVFFALSGYLVGGQMLFRMRTGAFDIVEYSCRRIVRLWIVVLPAVALTGIIDSLSQLLVGPQAYNGTLSSIIPSLPTSNTPASYSFNTLAGNIFFLQTILVPVYGSNGPLWSLANEFWYYVLGPLIAAVLIPRGAWISRVIAFALNISIMWLLPPVIIKLGLIWVCGALAAEAAMLPPIKNFLSNTKGQILAVTPACIAIALSRVPQQEVNDLIVGGLVATALPAVAAVSTSFDAFHAISKRLADISYSLYLTHFPLVVAVSAVFLLPNRLQPNSVGILFFVGLIALSLGWGMFIYWYFERHTDHAYCVLKDVVAKALAR